MDGWSSVRRPPLDPLGVLSLTERLRPKLSLKLSAGPEDKHAAFAIHQAQYGLFRRRL